MPVIPNRLYIACDHAGFDLKQYIKSTLIKNISKNCQIVDLGCDSSKESVDYPDFAQKLCKQIDVNNNEFGILICGSGIGMSICANKFINIRAALCQNQDLAFLSRAHNNANILCLGARFLDEEDAFNIVQTFISTPFSNGRHQVRIDKIEL